MTTVHAIRRQVAAVTYRPRHAHQPRHALRAPWWKSDPVVLAISAAGDLFDEAAQIAAVFLATLIFGGIGTFGTFALWKMSPLLAIAVFLAVGALIALIIVKVRRPTDE